LRLLHPVMPFITEEIWHAMYDGKAPLKSLALAAYPEAEESQIDPKAETEMAILQDLIVSVRNLRAELKVETKLSVPVEIFPGEKAVRKLIQKNTGALERLANVEQVRFVEESLAKLSGARHTARFDVRLVYEKKIDVAAEHEKASKELERLEKEKSNGERQLADEGFVSKAPANVVEQRRVRVEELKALIDKLKKKLDELDQGYLSG
jgi:valyl-tRNA synthetase